MSTTAKEVMELIDEGGKLNAEIKAKKTKLKAIKKKIMEAARTVKQVKLEGKTYQVNVSPRSVTAVDAKEVKEAYEEAGQADAFWGVVNIKVGDARETLGEIIFDGIAETTTVPYSAVKFTKIK